MMCEWINIIYLEQIVDFNVVLSPLDGVSRPLCTDSSCQPRVIRDNAVLLVERNTWRLFIIALGVSQNDAAPSPTATAHDTVSQSTGVGRPER